MNEDLPESTPVPISTSAPIAEKAPTEPAQEQPSITEPAKEMEPPIELKHREVYEGEGWKALEPLDRAQILLVSEGARNAGIVGADYTKTPEILKNLGLVEEQDEYSLAGELSPVWFIASQDNMANYQRAILTIPEVLADTEVQREMWKIQGEALGYPACCTEEYANPKKNLKAREAASPDRDKTMSNYEFELKQKIANSEEIPEELLYKPPTFTPCGADCKNARATLKRWQKIMKAADPEAARELREFNIATDEEMQQAFSEEFAGIKRKDEDSERLRQLRESLE